MDHITTLDVDGMTCANCEAHVREELEHLPGVRTVSVELSTTGPSRVRVVSDRAMADRALHEAVDEAGYTLTAIR